MKRPISRFENKHKFIVTQRCLIIISSHLQGESRPDDSGSAGDQQQDNNDGGGGNPRIDEEVSMIQTHICINLFKLLFPPKFLIYIYIYIEVFHVLLLVYWLQCMFDRRV